MTSTLRSTLLIGAVIALTSQSALADVTFEGASTSPTGSITSDGMVFSYSGEPYFHFVTDFPGAGASNGTNYLAFLASPSGYETFAMANQSLFNLSSLDLGGSANFFYDPQHPEPLPVTIIGTTATDEQLTTVVYLTNQFHRYDILGFNNLKSVRVGGLANDAYVAMDNINVTPVPEPGTYAMMLSGLGLMGLMMRRRRDPR